MTPEGRVSSAVRALLDVERVPYHRLNSGTMLVENVGRKRAIRMAPAGTADLLVLLPAIPHRRPVYLELKSAIGKQSPAQRDFEAQAKAWGIGYMVVRDVAEVQQLLKEAM